MIFFLRSSARKARVGSRSGLAAVCHLRARRAFTISGKWWRIGGRSGLLAVHDPGAHFGGAVQDWTS